MALGDKLSDLKSRLAFLLGALVVFRIGSHVPVPGVDYDSLRSVFAEGSSGILDYLNLFSGGALSRASVMALGIFPYITASIIMMLASYSIPWLEELRKEGEQGRRRINQYTRLFTVPLALFQSYGFAVGLEGLEVVETPGAAFRLTAMIGMLGGSMFLMWIGEQITERGIGNGISLLIFASIVSGLPVAVGQLFEQVRLGTYGPFTVIGTLLFVAGILAVVVFVERGQRRVLINYAKRQVGNRMVGGQASYLPLKVNMGGVMPAIFAYAIITFPTTILAFSSAGGSEWLRDLSAYLQRGTPLYFLMLAATIFFFAFFFVSLVYNARENADMLRKSGAFIPGIRPGEQTLSHLEKIVSRLTLIGAVYITVICLVPEVLFSQLSIAAIFGGTSVLIMVVVSIDFMEQIQHYLLTHQYGNLLKNAPGANKK
ncbi:preprotein translocase subunit SecY [Candidatus Persebacteraceae bacterium Df01]|jgi:preprotein translocase subunit SecY|uniref:Protein translocase subunit SecY n=1 Tax=Candidatus Doriopsillibacter californiensis TaxID=2970740 RepID=A0ABT7QLC0_9GAMM|nr:preprotein translocase subunit SecY [Candidatus Persebacteraceae bacterium Df01]